MPARTLASVAARGRFETIAARLRRVERTDVGEGVSSGRRRRQMSGEAKSARLTGNCGMERWAFMLCGSETDVGIEGRSEKARRRRSTDMARQS